MVVFNTLRLAAATRLAAVSLAAYAGFADAPIFQIKTPEPMAVSAADPQESPGATQTPDVGAQPEWVIAIHGGAGVKNRADLTPEIEAEYRAALQAALKAGSAILGRGGEGGGGGGGGRLSRRR